ncbi:MAG: hypothetical protein J6Y44_00795 [Clostridia bacterium]|nr:hypothetical protein [Clostridia bacterium]
MIRLWGKLYKDHKIVKDVTLNTGASTMDYSLFFDYMSEISHALDAPSPVVIKTHIFNFAKFNFVKFLKDDFVESVNFDYMLVELIKD